jgi:cytochrome c-type protein NapB
MRLKKSWIGALSLAMIIAAGCAAGAGGVSEESLGLRKTNLYAEQGTVAEETKYIQAAAGTSQKFERAFENAPPMIPHSTEGMLPITMANNSCTGCHMPEVAPSVNATPIPASHFASFRPKTKIGKHGEVIKEGKAVANTSDVLTVVHKQADLNMGRYNCSLCHAPQSNSAPLVKNTFEADFRSKDGASKSNLLDTLNEGVQ